MKKASLLVTAILSGLGVQAQAVGVQPAVKTVEAGKSWSRVQVKLGKAMIKPGVTRSTAFKWPDINKPIPNPHPVPTCGVRG